MAERSIRVQILGDSRQLERTFARAAKSASSFQATLSGVSRPLGGFTRGFASGAGALSSFGGALALTSGSFFAGAGLVAGLKASVGAAGDFQQTLNVLQQVSGATTKQLAAASAEARRLGADISLPATSALDAAQAMEQLAKGGLTVSQTIAATRGTLQLAAAAQTDVATAANTTARALTAFGLSGGAAGAVADALANAANAATGDITDFAVGLSQSATSAHQFGLTAQDTVTALTELAQAGILGSDAGTSLRVMLSRLIPTSKTARDEIQRLGVHVSDAHGQFLPFRDIVNQYATALEKLTPAQRQSALLTIFGTDAQRAANIILQGGVDRYDRLRDAVTRQGGAARAAAAQQKGFKGALDGFNSALQTTEVTIGTALLPVLTKYLRSSATWLGDSENQKRLQKDVAEAVRVSVGAIKDLAAVVKTASDAVGGFKNLLEILIAVKLGAVLLRWAAAARVLRAALIGLNTASIAASLGGIGTSAATSAGPLARLLGYLRRIARIGAISIAFRFPGLAKFAPLLSKLAGGAAGVAGFVASLPGDTPNVRPLDATKGQRALVQRLAKQGRISTAVLIQAAIDAGLDPRTARGGDVLNDPKAVASIIRALIDRGIIPKPAPGGIQKFRTDAGGGTDRGTGASLTALTGLGVGGVSAAQRNTFFDNAIARILLRGGLGSIQQQITALQKANALIAARLKVTKDVTRRLTLEDELLQNTAQIKDLNAQQATDALQKRQDAVGEFIARLQLGVTKAKATAPFGDDIAALKALQAGIRSEIKEFGNTADLASQLFDVQQQTKQARADARSAKLFRGLGLTSTGDEITPGVKNLRKRLAQLTENITGTSLDTPKLRSQLQKFRTTLAHNLLPQNIRAQVKEMMDAIADELKNHSGGNRTLFSHVNSNAILAGLGLSPAQIRALRPRVTQIGAGGMVPGAQSLAFSGAGAQNIVVQAPPVYLDGKLISSNTTQHQQKHAQRRSTPRRGTYAGRH